MSGHSAFAIHDLLEVICEHIHSDKSERDDALLSLALTCRAFADAALPARWRDLKYFSRLIKTLPSDCWYDGEIDTDPGVANIINSAQPITEQDCTRYKMYSSFVRYAQFCAGDKELVDCRFFTRLQTALGPRTPLLPNLRQLIWRNPACLDAPFIKYLLSPSLIHLDVEADGLPINYKSTLRVLHKKCPQLKRLQFLGNTHGGINEHVNVDLLAQGIPHMNRLAILCVSSLTDDLVLALVKKGYNSPLEDLLVRQDCPVKWNVVKSALGLKVDGRVKIPGLKRIVVRAQFQEILQLFGACSFLLESLYVHIKGCPWIMGDHFGQLLHEISCSVADKSALRRLGFEIDSVAGLNPYSAASDPIHDARAVKWSQISSILEFPNLWSFRMYSNHGFDIEDKEIETIAKGLPHLTEFCLYSGRLYLLLPQKTITTTINGLSHLAIHCPNLKIIRMAVNATNPQPLPPTLIEALTSKPSQVAWLVIPHSHVNNPEVVASIISTLFPKLEYVNFEKRFPHGGSSWDRVEAFVELVPRSGESPHVLDL